jgi:hypothetical protein
MRLGKRERLLRRQAFETLDSFKDQGQTVRREIMRSNLSEDKPSKPVLSASIGRLGSKSARFRSPVHPLPLK